MNQLFKPEGTPVPPDEIKRREDLYRQEAYKKRAMPHAVYQDPFIMCPWTDCGYRMCGVDFQLEKGSDGAFYQQAVSAWWNGEGLAARCPGCGKYVLFSVSAKNSLDESDLQGKVVLADDWHQQAYIING